MKLKNCECGELNWEIGGEISLHRDNVEVLICGSCGKPYPDPSEIINEAIELLKCITPISIGSTENDRYCSGQVNAELFKLKKILERSK